MRHERIKVKRDTLTVHNLTVPPWEIPLIEYMFEEVEHTDTFVYVDREYPDPGQEFFRLQKAYGQDMKTEIPHAVTVFGAARQGVKALKALIDAARREDERAEPAPEPTMTTRRRYALDPLMS